MHPGRPVNVRNVAGGTAAASRAARSGDDSAMICQVGHQADLVGCVGDELPEKAEHRGRVVHRPPHNPSEHGRAERVQLEREARDDAEVAAPPRSPEKGSGFSCSLATTNSPSAVTTSQERRPSMASPNLRIR